jgi:glycosyltransferase involved in cell wall biosynthesis
MRILHTESSNGWGGQEIRILQEAKGMRLRGHEIILAVVRGGQLASRARLEGFTVYEIDFSKGKALWAIYQLLRLISLHHIELVNTHSSLDAWLGGIAARLKCRKVIRTRHLSTEIRAGLNSKLLYDKLADFVVTTSSCIIPIIAEQAGISSSRCGCVATGIQPTALNVDPSKVAAFRKSLGLSEGDLLIGTACMVRSWKGVQDLIRAASHLRQFKWVIIGGGYLDLPKQLVAELKLENVVHFTGHLEPPYAAMAALDIFTLLSTGHEGISQALLQAAYLQKPLIATKVGGSPEVCLDGKTGKLVDPGSPHQVVEAVLELAQLPLVREQMGLAARQLVEGKFTLVHTLNEMERIYEKIMGT